MRKMITVEGRILINSNKEHVWNFTQDIGNRKLWDNSVIDCQLIQRKPKKVIWVKMKGGIQSFLNYKLCDKPNKTSLKMYNTQSFLVKGGGGSWQYKEKEGKTEWVQTNTIEFKSKLAFLLLGWVIKRIFKKNTDIAMTKAKQLIENGTMHFNT